MGEDHPAVAERALAARASGRVADRLGDGPTDRRIIDPEREQGPPEAVPEVRHDRIVGIEHERRLLGEHRHRGADPAGQGVDLEVAVELVAEQVRDHQNLRRQTREDARDGGLIELEHADVTAELTAPGRVGHQRGDDPAVQIRARAVVHGLPSRQAHDVRQHSRGRRLPVRAGDADHTMRERGGEPRDRIRIDRERHQARKRRGPAAEQLQSGARRLAGGDRGEQKRIAFGHAENVRRRRAGPRAARARARPPRDRGGARALSRRRRSRSRSGGCPRPRAGRAGRPPGAAARS